MSLANEQINELKELEEIIRTHVDDKWQGRLLASMCVGSHAYGTNVPSSDIDMRAIHSVHIKHLLTVNPMTPQSNSATVEIRSHENKEIDINSTEIGKFCSLCLKCNPSVLEMLYMPDKMILNTSDIFENLRHNREKFITKKQMTAAYVGYATAQAERFLKPIFHIYRLDKMKVDLFKPDSLEAMWDGLLTKDTSVTYDCKNAMHCVRLLLCVKYALKEGKLLVHMGEFEYIPLLKQIRNNELSLYEIINEIHYQAQQVRALEQSSKLPEQADDDFIDNMLYEFRIKEVL